MAQSAKLLFVGSNPTRYSKQRPGRQIGKVVSLKKRNLNAGSTPARGTNYGSMAEHGLRQQS